MIIYGAISWQDTQRAGAGRVEGTRPRVGGLEARPVQLVCVEVPV
jgi:hypothetical protein